MEWPRNKTIELIEMYENYPELWDPFHSLFRDKEKRKESLKKLADAFGCSVSDIGKKLNNLKSQYSRESQRLEKNKKSYSNDVYVPKWFGFKMMDYLDKDSSSKKKDKGLRLSQDSKKDYHKVLDLEDISNDDIKYQDNGVALPTSTSTASSTITSNKDCTCFKRKFEESTLDEAIAIIKSFKGHNLDEQNEFNIFGKYVAMQLGKLKNPFSLSVAKLKINKVLFEAETGIYTQREIMSPQIS